MTRIDDADALRAGDTGAVLGPRGVGALDVGHVPAQLHVGPCPPARPGRRRSCSPGPGRPAPVPATAPVTIDIDSTICETYGLAKQGGVVRLHQGARLPPVARGRRRHRRRRAFPPARRQRQHRSRRRTVLDRDGQPGPRRRGHRAADVARRLRVLQPHGRRRLPRRHDVRFSITVKLSKALHNADQRHPRGRLAADPVLPRRWRRRRRDRPTGHSPRSQADQPHPCGSSCAGSGPHPAANSPCSSIYDYHAFITDRDGDTLELEADHRRHAEVENAIRDLKYGVGLNHLPSGRFGANAAWLALNVIAHNLSRWTSRLGLGENIIATTHCVAATSPPPDASPAAPDNQHCTYPHDGHGATASSPPSPTCEPSSSSPEPDITGDPPPEPGARSHHHPNTPASTRARTTTRPDHLDTPPDQTPNQPRHDIDRWIRAKTDRRDNAQGTVAITV